MSAKRGLPQPRSRLVPLSVSWARRRPPKPTSRPGMSEGPPSVRGMTPDQ
jgi:hypothetical protein